MCEAACFYGAINMSAPQFLSLIHVRLTGKTPHMRFYHWIFCLHVLNGKKCPKIRMLWKWNYLLQWCKVVFCPHEIVKSAPEHVACVSCFCVGVNAACHQLVQRRL